MGNPTNFRRYREGQCNVLGEYGIGRARTAEPIELPFEMVTGVSLRNRVFDRRAHWRHLANTVE